MNTADLRKSSFSSRNITSVRVTVLQYDDESGQFVDREFEVVQPTLAERGKILKGISDSPSAEVAGLLKARAVIACVRNPETKQLVFSDEDMPQLLAQGSGGWVDKLGDEVVKLLHGRPEVVEKNSEATPSAS